MEGEGPSGGPPVFAVGFGSPDHMRDREGMASRLGEQRLDQATVDLHVSAVASGFGRAPFVLRVLANGREIEARRVVPTADGAPIDEVFTVAPDATVPTVYTAEIPPDQSEAIAENNARSVLVNPAGRRRRLLMIEGAPGFEHTFMRRAWSRDPGLEVDAVGRKGKNVDGQDTFFVQAAPSRRGGADARVSGPSRGSLRLRRHHPGGRRGRLADARPAGDDSRFRVRTRRRPAHRRGPIVRAARPGRHADRRGDAGGTERPSRHPAAVGRRPGQAGHGQARAHCRRRRDIRRCGSATPRPTPGGCGRRFHRSRPRRRSAVRGRARRCSP